MIIESKYSPNRIALVPIRKPIATGDSMLMFMKSIPSSNIIQLLEILKKDRKTKALILEINCTGGTPYACEEIAKEIRNFGKPTIAWIREIAASGGYWIASACDYIVADELSLIGSIGVISLRVDLSELLKKLAVNLDAIANSPEKLFGFPPMPISEAERQSREQQVQTIHQQFIAAINVKRHLAKEAIAQISSGKTFLGKEAMGLGLVNYLGGRVEALSQAASRANIPNFRVVDCTAKISPKRGLLQRLLLGN